MGYDLVSDAATVKAEGVPTPGKEEGHVRFIPPGVFFCRHCGDNYAPAMPAPVNLIVAMSEAFNVEHKGHRLSPKGLACNFCFKFGHETFSCPKLYYNGNPEAWWRGPDTGASSKALWMVLTGHWDVLRVDAVPHDAADFGRCQRLLMAIPGWRARIGEMALAPKWGQLVAAWDELEALYNEEWPTGLCPKLYARMKELGV
jgi:hypothetical protein